MNDVPEYRLITPAMLPTFIAEVDALGGPGAPAADGFMAGCRYVPETVVDTSLDPFSPEYFAQMLALYSEISGRALDQLKNEDTHFDLERHVAAVNSYDHWMPGLLADHWLRLAAALRLAAPHRGHLLLDMGCGWGLSSEFMALSGLRVLAMDVNAKFVELVNRRAARLGYDITAVQGEFETYGPPGPVDLVLFYECLHHAPRPWYVLARMASALAVHDKAQIVLAGEPIQAFWWPHWGLRLDSLSVYVMHRFGWFESGFSLPFIQRCLAAAALEPRVAGTDGVGEVIAAGGRLGLGLGWLAHLAEVEGIEAAPDGSPNVVFGAATIRFGTLPDSATLVIRVLNYRPRPVPLTTTLDGVAASQELPMGPSRLTFPGIRPGSVLTLDGEGWVPAEEIGNLDTRRLSFHIDAFEWHPDGLSAGTHPHPPPASDR